jgi:hypothetical protein
MTHSQNSFYGFPHRKQNREMRFGMVPFYLWLEKFSRDKRLVGIIEQSEIYAVHTLRRYIDNNGTLWEVGQTYTDRIVVRTGSMSEGGLTVNWSDWETQQDIALARE